MDRMYLAEHKVTVFENQEAREKGQVLRTFQDKPYSRCGFDNYRDPVTGRVYPGYTSPSYETYIILTDNIMDFYPSRTK